MSIAIDPGDRQSRTIPTPSADDLIAASGACRSDRVMISGAGQIDLLIAFIKRGFSNVGCRSAAGGPHASRGETDLLIVPRMDGEAGLRGLLEGYGSGLRSGGVLVLCAPGRCDSGGERRLRQILLEAGFAAIERIPERGGAGHLWCARKQAAALARAA